MNQFEQLIEYVINDDEAKARELFHDIVVDKSRKIYEDLMAEDDAMPGNPIRAIEMDEVGVMETDDEDDLGGDASDDFMHDVEMDTDDADSDADSDDMADADLEDRVVDLEDKLDELMAEFESLMGDTDAGDDMDAGMGDDDMGDDDMDADAGGDSLEMDDTEEMMENVSLKPAPKPVTSEEGSINKKSTTPTNSGARGAVANPVRMTGDTAQGRPNPTTKDLIGRVGNTPAQSSGQKLSAATKPVSTQAAGVNTKTPFPKA